MRAVVYKGQCSVAVEQVPDARIEAPTDAIVKLASTAICGSDLHMYEGRTAAQPGIVFGHENMGVIHEVGPGVQSLKSGDRVVLPFNIGCGFCFNCVRGFVPVPRWPGRLSACAVCRLQRLEATGHAGRRVGR